jgi:hypothetical protein
MADFGASIGQAYATDGAVIDLGRGLHEGALSPEAVVRLPLATMNRQGKAMQREVMRGVFGMLRKRF